MLSFPIRRGKMLKKILLLSLALVLTFSLVAFVGCKEKMTQEEIDQIIAGAADANYETVSFDIELPTTMKISGGEDPGTMIVNMSGIGAMDIVNEAMQMTMNMVLDMMGESQDVTGAIYVLDGWMYTGMSIPGYDEQWNKMALTEEMWQQQDQVEQYIRLLATAIKVDYKGIETVNSVECYVFELEPDMDILQELLAQETASGMSLVDLSGLDLAELYKELSVKEWLAKDNYRLQRTEVKIVMEVSPEDVGATSADFSKMTIDMNMNMRFYAYNQPFSVVLPPEAENAVEVPIPD
jgi:uncharacterized tellurite resistance protein B-like protein